MAGVPLQLPAGQDLCEVDDVADCIWILHEGLVAEVDANGIEAHDRMAPAVLGETALLRARLPISLPAMCPTVSRSLPTPCTSGKTPFYVSVLSEAVVVHP